MDGRGVRIEDGDELLEAGPGVALGEVPYGRGGVGAGHVVAAFDEAGRSQMGAGEVHGALNHHGAVGGDEERDLLAEARHRVDVDGGP